MSAHRFHRTGQDNWRGVSHRSSGFTRDQIHGPLDRDEACMLAAWRMVGKAFPWLFGAAVIGALLILGPAAKFSWVNVW